ncbi:MAG TPA: FtsX-like permease family protein [Streptosporangiaceae bacterium]|nr:FtsX-like permease family protein [Streptosporangiaceae bacterium]
MNAVWMRLRSELRTRWRAWLGLVLLIGLAGAAAAAAAAGARRTETAYPRFVQAQNGYDLITGGFPGRIDPGRALAKMEALPEVAQWARVDMVASSAVLPSGRVAPAPELMAVTDLMERAGFRLNRFKVISGRMVNLRAPGEAVVDFPTADREGLRVGSVVRFIVGDPDAQRPRSAAVRIVGIVASPGQFPAVGASSAFGSVYVTPAFVRSNGIRPSPRDAALLVRLRHGAAGGGAFVRQMRAAGLGSVDIPEVQPTQTAGIQRSIRLESQALWALSVLIGLAAFAIVGQSLARQTYLDSAELPALWALGFSRTQLFWLGIARAAIIGTAAGCVVVPVAVLLSPLAPVGLARIAEPDPGFAVDGVPLVLGAALVALFTVLASTIPAWTGAGIATRGERPAPGRRRSPPLPHALSRAWYSPAAATGVRMALQPGRGRTAVPVRSAIFGATLGVAALTASLVLAASLGHLLRTPRLSGFTWDAFVSVEGGLPKAAAALRADPKIAGYTRGGFTGVRIGQLQVMALVLGGPGPARPVITAGVAPTASDEVALGAATMRAAHTAIGQTVNLAIDKTEGHPKPARMRVVGTVIVPPTPFLATKLGDGAALALPGLLRIDPGAARQLGGAPFLVRFDPGVSRDAGLAAVANDIKGLPNPYVNAAERPASVVSLAAIAGLPVALAGLLALIAAGTLAHTLASSTRRRRRDLAVLKTLGFTRRQLRQAVAWQATTIAAIALLIGLPAGVAGGRWAWRYLAAQLGVLPEPAVPLTAIIIAIPAALVVANLIAAVPGQAAARIPPAAVLRTE